MINDPLRNITLALHRNMDTSGTLAAFSFNTVVSDTDQSPLDESVCDVLSVRVKVSARRK